MKKSLILFILIHLLLLAACQTSSGMVSSKDSQAGSDNSALINQGKSVFQANCSACHNTSNVTVLVGPSLLGLATRAGNTVDGMDARGYIEESILDPAAYINEGFQNLMPVTYINSLSEEDLNALVEYLLTFE